MMTIEEGIGRIQELFVIEVTLKDCLEEFKEVCQDSPLSNAEEDTLIGNYESSIAQMVASHFIAISSYLDWIIAARAT